MTLRRRGALGTRKARTQGARVAALRTRLRTTHGAAQCGPPAEVSFFSSLPACAGRRAVARGDDLEAVAFFTRPGGSYTMGKRPTRGFCCPVTPVCETLRRRDTMNATKYVYDFSEGQAGLKSPLGGKGANLSEITAIGIP